MKKDVLIGINEYLLLKIHSILYNHFLAKLAIINNRFA